MRALPVGPVTPLLGSLGLHGCLVLALLIAVRRPLELASAPIERADAWAGDAVEVDAVATPDGVPNIPNAESPLALAPAAVAPPAAATPAEVEPVPTPAPKADPESVPAPKKHVPRPLRHPNAEPAASPTPGSVTATAADGSGKPATQAATGAFGADELPPGVRSLSSAFTRAIPPATGADPLWQTLPAGKQRPFTIAVRVDADGHIQDSKIVDDHPGPPPEQFTHLRERVVALLGAGLFALQNNVSAGSGLFRITITLSDRAVKEDSEPALLVERGFDPPRGAEAGRAYFTLASGRHFEARVEVLTGQHAH
ncbi:MAG TPA: hypothetical protein VIK01_15975 [Polyangiaceae bacterium]